MAVSIKKHFSFEGSQQEIELKRAFTAVLNDNTAMRASLVALTAKLDTDFAAQNTQVDLLATNVNTLVSKLNTDFAAQNAAVTSSQLDTDYAATSSSSQLDVNYAATVDPAALELTA